MRNVGTLRVNKYLSLINSTWNNDSDFSYAGFCFVEVFKGNNGYIKNVGNNFVSNVIGRAFATNGNYISGHQNYNRPSVEMRDQIFVTTNVTDWAGVKTIFSDAGVAIPFNTAIQTWLTDLSFIKRASAKNADITDGDDVIENWGS